MLHVNDNTGEDIASLMAAIGRKARAAARPLAIAKPDRKHAALIAMADALERQQPAILAANAIDMANGVQVGLSAASMDRLKLTADRIRDMAKGVRAIAGLTDPIGEVTASWDRPNGLHIERVRTPLGVIGVIYESRPNVTADAGALCLKAGNPVIRAAARSVPLVGGDPCLPGRGAESGKPARRRHPACAGRGPRCGRCHAFRPRRQSRCHHPPGGKSLVARVQSEARVPVFAHLEGICHLYVDRSARLDMAVAVNAKMRRTGICGAAETLLVDRAVAGTHLVPILDGTRQGRLRNPPAPRFGRRFHPPPPRSMPTGPQNISMQSFRFGWSMACPRRLISSKRIRRITRRRSLPTTRL